MRFVTERNGVLIELSRIEIEISNRVAAEVAEY